MLPAYPGIRKKRQVSPRLMKTLGQMDPEERKTTGQALNVLKDEIADLIADQEKMP